MTDILLCGNNGKLIKYNIEMKISSIVFQVENMNEYLMGICYNDNFIYVGSNYIIYILDKKTFKLEEKIRLGNIDGHFQHLRIIDNKLFISAPNIQLLIVCDLKSKKIEQHKIGTDVVFMDKHFRYEHIKGISKINDILKYKNRYLLSFGLLHRSITDGFSLIKEFDMNFNNTYNYNSGWKVSRIYKEKDKLWVLTNGFLENEIEEAECYNYSELIIDKNNRIRFDNIYTLYDFSIDSNENIYIVGKIVDYKREIPKFCAFLSIFNKEFQLVENIQFVQINSIYGCTIIDNDKTNMDKIE